MGSDIDTERIISARELREHLLKDRYRPGYHFAVPEDIGKPGDPNGAFYAGGRYHLMYLYNRRGIRGWKGNGFCWGHISSADLVHWRHHPDAILPGDGDGGCFSGGGFVDEDGTAYLTYWRLPTADEGAAGSGIGIARSRDRHYDTWEKLGTPTLDATEFGIMETVGKSGKREYLCNADPSNIWKKNGVYYLQAGNLLVLNRFGREEGSPAEFRGDWVDLFRSRDLVAWEYVHRFYRRDAGNGWTRESEDDMCPSFLPLPGSPEGGAMSGKHLQLFISHNMGCQYYIGTYDEGADLFIPERHGRMSWVDNTFFAPEALIDGRGRQIMWSWLTDDPHSSLKDDLSDGWAGVYGLPRTLWLAEDGTLGIAPVPELSSLRYNARRFDPVVLGDGGERRLEGVYGESCELGLTIDPGSAVRVGVEVRTSPKGEETTLICYDAAAGKLVFDAVRSGGMGRRVAEEAPFALRHGEALELRVFIDRSVVEVFANGRQAVTRRVYPVRGDSDGVRLFCKGGTASFDRIDTWEMMPSNGW